MPKNVTYHNYAHPTFTYTTPQGFNILVLKTVSHSQKTELKPNRKIKKAIEAKLK